MSTEITGAGEPKIRLLDNALGLIQMKLRREAAGPPLPSGPQAQQLQDFFQRLQQGLGSESDLRLYAQMVLAHQLSSLLLEQNPWLGLPVSPAEEARAKMREELTPIFDRLRDASGNCVPGKVTAESLNELEQILAACQSLIARTESDNPAMAEAFYLGGNIALMLAKSRIIAGDNDQGRAAFEMAARHFEKAGDAAQAAQCRETAEGLAKNLAAERDKSAKRHLAALLASSAGVPSWERVQSLVSLADLAGKTGDVVEAEQNAEAAAHELARLGFRDPPEHGVDDAIDSWIAAASANCAGTLLLQRISEVGLCYISIFKARLACALKRKPGDVENIEGRLIALQQAMMEAQREADSAAAELNRELGRYIPQMAEARPEGDGGGDELLPRMRAIDSALLNLREECNQRTAGESREDLLAAAEQLQRDAFALNTPIYDARTRLERVYILLSLGRAQEMLPLAREARAILLAGRPPGLASLPQTFERACYLESLSREAMAHVILGDFRGAWQTCEETIRDFERERYRVNSPYRQSAILGAVVEFYKLGAFAACKLRNWDNMIEAIELIKARSAIRGRLIPDPPEFSESELAREFEATSAALQSRRTAGGGIDEITELTDRRRRLWDMLAISRGRNGAVGELPPLRLTSLQATLADDEAVIGYFWLNQGTLLVMCMDHERFVAERVNLTPAQRKLFDDFISFVQVFKVAQRSMGAAVAKLGDILLPQFARDFAAAKKRLIFSPHQALHLFPFHAARWGAEAEYVGTHFAVRYVPNFSSLLLPWRGGSGNGILVIAIRDFADAAVPPLANVEQDVMAIQEYYAAQGIPVEALTGKAATRERLEQMRAQDRLSHFRCIHLGTHGLSVYETPDQPMESALLLQDSSLDAADIARLRFSADLAVLSACHSGQRAIAARDLGELPGDDIFGLQSALFQSGVRSVLGTLWHVETESSSVIVRAFHRHYSQGHAEEIALQLAIREYVEDSPRRQGEIYYWAPYFISSLGRSPDKKEN